MPTIKMQPPQSLIAPPQSRKDYGTLEELVSSLKLYGMLQPIGVRDGNVIVFGFRRYHAALLAGLDEVPTVELAYGMSEIDYLLMQATENLQRKDLTPPEELDICVEILNLNPGMTDGELSQRLGKHPSRISRILAARNLCPEAYQAFRDGKIPVRAVPEISSLPHAEQPAMLQARLGGATVADLAAKKKAIKKPAPAVRASKIKVPLTSGMVVQFTGAEASLEEAIEAAGESIKLMKAALAKNLTVKTAVRYWSDIAAG